MINQNIIVSFKIKRKLETKKKKKKKKKTQAKVKKKSIYKSWPNDNKYWLHDLPSRTKQNRTKFY